jgi:uncharacterized membrane protein
MEQNRLQRRLAEGDPLWPPQLALASSIALHLALSQKVTLGPRWLVPAIEALLLAALVVVAPVRAAEHEKAARRLALTVIGVVSLANLVSLILLIHYLVSGGHTGGRQLIESGGLLWLTNVLLFSVWYWEMDRGGPVHRHLDPDAPVDFQFPQMENPQFAPAGWRPGYADYLYTSLTNATAFSPTDVMPLTQTAKLVMAIQSVSALLTIGLVIARAVNCLGWGRGGAAREPPRRPLPLPQPTRTE